MIMFFALLAIIAPLIKAIVEEQAKLGSSSSSRLILYGVVTVLFLTAVIVVMLFVRLKTKVTYDGICIIFIPFVRKWKKIAKDDIASYELRKFQAILEYGGYGMRTRRKAGKAYTISGNIGLQLYLKNGKKLLIGTQKQQAIKYAMDKLMGDEIKTVHQQKTASEQKSIFGSKAKKVLIIIAIEIMLAIVIFSLIQIFK